MKRSFVKFAVVISSAVLAISLLAGNALAHAGEPVDGATGGGRLAQMIQWMGPENWGQMIQQMNQIHGPEWTAQMIQHMNEDDDHCMGDWPGGMMGQGFGSWNRSVPGGMMRGR